MTKEEFLRRRRELDVQSNNFFNKVADHAAEEKRIIDVLHNSRHIIDNLDKTFEERTALSKTDVIFLLLATSLQLIRIYLLPKFQEKIGDNSRLDHNDPSIKDWERDRIDEYKNNPKHSEWGSVKSSKGYRSWQEIAFTIKVPYDSTRHSGAGFNERNMHGGYHRVKTLGHDPILGWVFGVANILTDTITICPEYELGEKKLPLPYLESYEVDMDSDFCWKGRTSTVSVFSGSMESIGEDKHRLYAAIFSQGLHLASDKYTKLGLPVPFLSALNPDKAFQLYKEGYDYLDYLYDTQILRRTLKSASQSMFINMIIGGLHKLFYNPSEDHSHELYQVRTRKILLYSNTIATSSDIIQTSIRAYHGDENAIKNFDIGGFLVTLYRLINDTAYIQKVKEEFIFREWDRIIESKDNIFNI